MGICYSKKKMAEKERDKKEKEVAVSQQEAAEDVASTEKKLFFAITQNTKKATSAAFAAEEKDEEIKKKGKLNIKNGDSIGVGIPGKEPRPAAVRTSSCTKEEVDAILIQCGQLSCRSSGKASNDTAAASAHRKYLGSKRSYDFDNEKSRDEEEDWDKPLSRSSPHRRTPNREMESGRDYKRSGSRERGRDGGSRRVSRSPGRRSDGPASSASDKSKQQPAKIVSVPAREKGAAAAEGGRAMGVKRVSAPVSSKRNASLRSQSPANTTRVSNENALHQPTQPQSLSRSSLKKAEQSPYRRNPMAEIDNNSLRENQNSSYTNKALKSREGEEGVRKPSQVQTQKISDQRNGGAVDVPNAIKSYNNTTTTTISNCIREQMMSCRAKEKQPEPEIVEEAKEVKGASKGIEVESLNPRNVTRTRSSRRSSRDLDHILGLNLDNTLPNPTSYTSLLLEDIQNYHQQNAAISLPSCVSKACSILEAVADLNSSSSDQSNYDNGRLGRRGLAPRETIVESEIVVKDDLMEPSLHKYISVRDLEGEMEPQESAGSNIFIGQPWASSWEPNSVDSTEHYWTSQSNHGEESEESLAETAHDFDAQERRLRSSSSSSSSLPVAMTLSGKKREFDHRQLHRGGNGSGGRNGKGGGRASSLPVAAATS